MGTFRSSVPGEDKYRSGMSLVPRQGNATESLCACERAVLCCPPSPRGWGTPVPSPALPPFAATRRMPEHTVLTAGRERRDAKQQCDLGRRDMERDGTRHSIPGVPAYHTPQLGVRGCMLWGKADKSAGSTVEATSPFQQPGVRRQEGQWE